MEITAKQVKGLREKTGLGMMECKRALAKSDGDVTLAIDLLRKEGAQISAGRAGKEAKQGIVSVVGNHFISVLYEINSETDFVARNPDFEAFVRDIGNSLLKHLPVKYDHNPTFYIKDIFMQDRFLEILGKLKENIVFRRYELMEAGKSEWISSYQHGKKISVAVKLNTTEDTDITQFGPNKIYSDLGKDIAMQIAAANPVSIGSDDVPTAILEHEKEIYREQVKMSGKPEKIWDRIVEGKLNKFYQESTLVNQKFIKTPPEITVMDRIKQAGHECGGHKIKVVSFVRMELGEDI